MEAIFSWPSLRYRQMRLGYFKQGALLLLHYALLHWLLFIYLSKILLYHLYLLST